MSVATLQTRRIIDLIEVVLAAYRELERRWNHLTTKTKMTCNLQNENGYEKVIFKWSERVSTQNKQSLVFQEQYFTSTR